MFEYWQQFVNTQIDGYDNIDEHQSPSHYNWLGQGFGYSGLSIVVTSARHSLRVQEVVNESDKTQTVETFDWLEAHKDNIQSSVAVPILWQRNPEKIHSLLTPKKQDFGYAEPECWEDCIEYMIKTSQQPKLAIKDIIEIKP